MQKGNEKTDGQEKVLTKYDRKLQASLEAEAKERRTRKIMKWAGILLGAVIIVGTIGGIAVSVYQKKAALNNTYIEVGEHAVTKQEYDYYFHSILQDYETTYASLMGMIGLDLNKDLSKQAYSEVMSWKDFFDKMTVNQVTQVKTLLDEAAKNEYTSDTSEGYEAFVQNMSSQAEAAGITLKEYVKNTYGKYATPENVEPIIKENLLAAAYYDELMQQKAPDEGEVSAYYEEHRNEYDTMNYRILPFKAELDAEATEDEVADALTILSRTAEEMKEEIEAGGDFKTLCAGYAQEDSKADYEDTEKDASLVENATYAQTNEVYGNWLFEDGRKAGDLTVVSDPSNREVYIVEYVARNTSDTTNDTISNLLATQAVEEYLNSLKDQYALTSTAGKLEYIDKEEDQLKAEQQRESQARTDDAEGTQEAGTAEESADTGETQSTQAAE